MKNLVRHLGFFTFFVKSLNNCKSLHIDTLILWLVYRLTRYNDHDIIYKSLEYEQRGGMLCDFNDRFWINEQRKWQVYFSKHDCIFSSDYIPECINNYKLTIKYFYSGKIYKYISKNKIPLIDNTNSSMVVRNPLIMATQVFRDRHVNITKRLNRVIGPRGDCHNEKLTCDDIFPSCDDYFILLNTVVNNGIVLKKHQFIPQL